MHDDILGENLSLSTVAFSPHRSSPSFQTTSPLFHLNHPTMTSPPARMTAAVANSTSCTPQHKEKAATGLRTTTGRRHRHRQGPPIGPAPPRCCIPPTHSLLLPIAVNPAAARSTRHPPPAPPAAGAPTIHPRPDASATPPLSSGAGEVPGPGAWPGSRPQGGRGWGPAPQ
jgi:hypothetical protein